MKKLPTVTIGIPAHNEETNIGLLLRDVFEQDCSLFKLERIIVSSDGSRDRTVQVVNSLKNSKTVLIDNSQCKGVATRQNEIVKMTKSDVLVLLNADIRIPKLDFIANLIAPIVGKAADLTSPLMVERTPRSFIESILEISTRLKAILFESWRNGQNGYLCRGSVRAFSQRFYKRLKFKESEGEDMYSYLMCIQNNYSFRYVKAAYVTYRLPKTLHDHFKQSVRFFKYQVKFAREFDTDLVNRELKIPLSIYVKAAFKSLPIIIRAPRLALGYILIVCVMRIRSTYLVKDNLWDAVSTKTNA